MSETGFEEVESLCSAVRLPSFADYGVTVHRLASAVICGASSSDGRSPPSRHFGPAVVLYVVCSSRYLLEVRLPSRVL